MINYIEKFKDKYVLLQFKSPYMMCNIAGGIVEPMTVKSGKDESLVPLPFLRGILRYESDDRYYLEFEDKDGRENRGTLFIQFDPDFVAYCTYAEPTSLIKIQ